MPSGNQHRNGNGSFQSATNIGAGVFPKWNSKSIAAGDFNRDGRPDLVVATETGVSVLLNTSPCSGIHLKFERSKGM